MWPTGLPLFSAPWSLQKDFMPTWLITFQLLLWLSPPLNKDFEVLVTSWLGTYQYQWKQPWDNLHDFPIIPSGTCLPFSTQNGPSLSSQREAASLLQCTKDLSFCPTHLNTPPSHSPSEHYCHPNHIFITTPIWTNLLPHMPMASYLSSVLGSGREGREAQKHSH